VLIALAASAAVAIVVGLALIGHSSSRGPARYLHAQLEAGGEVYRYALYLPPGYRTASATPLVVVLHGCNMTPDQQAAASRYDAIAEQHRFAVLYPDVDAVDAANGHCWKGIWNPGAEGRGHGDAAAIAVMTSAVMTRWHIDRNRVYAIGISAGAFEASILGADYPDLYAAIGIHSGAAYMGGESGCVPGNGSPADTETLARGALAAMGPRARVMPVIVFHGDQDDLIPYHCGQQALAQWLRTDNLVLELARRPALPATPTISQATVPGGHAYTVASYPSGSGCPVAQLWTVHGMGHFWSGGSADPASALFSDPKGPRAAVASWAFFSRWRLSGPAARCAGVGR
jgi:poly(hydroxyalkanoate) depolymerase family esterase